MRISTLYDAQDATGMRGAGAADHFGFNVSFGIFPSVEHVAVVCKSVSPPLLVPLHHPPELKHGFCEEFSELLSKMMNADNPNNPHTKH